MFRRVMVLLLSLTFIWLSGPSPAAWASTLPVDAKLHPASKVAINALKGMSGKTAQDILSGQFVGKVLADPANAENYAASFTRDIDSLKSLNKVAKGLGYVKNALEIGPGAWRFGWAMGSREWDQAWQEAKGVLVKIAKMEGGALGATEAAGLAMAGCSVLLLGALPCIGLVTLAFVAGNQAGGYISEKSAHWLLERGEVLYCRSRRTGNGTCEPTPIFVSTGGGGSWDGGAGINVGSNRDGHASSPIGPSGGKATARTGRGRVSVGSTTANVSARSLTATAEGAGSTAQNNIGSLDRGGSANVSVRSVATTAAGGQDSVTNIGTGGADSVTANNIVNEGGDLTIGSRGVSRDGRKCIDVYRSTCIVHMYYPKKREPCIPGYWRVLNQCKLPSDTSHKIPGF